MKTRIPFPWWLLFALLILPAPAPAADGPVLVAGLAHGAPYDSLAARPGAYDCSELLDARALCLDGQEYLGHAWDFLLEFRDERLVMVSLFTPYSEDAYRATFRELAGEFRLVAMQSDEPVLDLVALEHTIGKHAPYSGEVVEYEQRGMARGQLAYVLLERSALPEHPAPTALELRSLAAPVVREAGVVLSRDEEGREWLSVSFSCPLLSARRAVEN